jgi:hypothetical protein
MRQMYSVWENCETQIKFLLKKLEGKRPLVETKA